MEKVWETKIVGSPFHVFNEKLKLLKKALVHWSKTTFGDVFKNIATLKDLGRIKEILMEIHPSKDHIDELKREEAELRKMKDIEKDY